MASKSVKAGSMVRKARKAGVNGTHRAKVNSDGRRGARGKGEGTPRVTLIPGDGVGPEVIGAAVKVIEAVGVKIDWDRQLGGAIYVTYALQDADKEDDVAGVGHGFVDAFDLAGNLLHRVASKGRLNSPWGLAIAPADFGKFSGNLLVGNFGDGHINAFDLSASSGKGELQQRGQLHAADGQPIAIDGLWAIAFGNGAAAGPRNTLFFTAGPFDEEHGLFGRLVVTTPPEP